jgi:ribonuclease HII
MLGPLPQQAGLAAPLPPRHATDFHPSHSHSGKIMTTSTLSKTQRDELLKTLKSRFEKSMNRHPGLVWAEVAAKLQANPT